MSEFGIFKGEDLINSPVFIPKPLVSNLLYENNNVLCVADVKSGKSVFTLQMAYDLTTGNAFLDEFEIPEPVNVLYVQTEGSKHDTEIRMKRMVKAIPFEPSRFRLYYHWGLALNTEQGFKHFLMEIEKANFRPKVIFFDPLYTMIRGNPSDPEVTGRTVSHFHLLNDIFGCANWINHHVRKVQTDPKGNVIEEGDQAVYGSQFWRAFVDHIFIARMNKGQRFITFTCETQRSGDIQEKIGVFMHQPDPLWLEMGEKIYPNKLSTLECLKETNGQGMTAEQLRTKLNVSRRTIYSTLRELQLLKKVVKFDTTYPVLYKLIETI